MDWADEQGSALREGSSLSSLILTILPLEPALVTGLQLCTPEQERKSGKRSDEKGAGEEKWKEFELLPDITVMQLSVAL